MRRVAWSDQSLDDLEEITTYIRHESPAAAARLESRIVEVAEDLVIMPDRGRPISRQRRELAVLGSYLIRYVVVGHEVRILSVRHTARRPMD